MFSYANAFGHQNLSCGTFHRLEMAFKTFNLYVDLEKTFPRTYKLQVLNDLPIVF